MTPIPRKTYLMVSVGSLLALFTIWCILTYGKIVDPFYLPSPTEVWQAGVKAVQDGTLAFHVGASVFRVGVGFVLAAAIAIPLGILMGSLKIAEAVFEPIVDFVRYLPVSALLGLLLVYFGIDELEKISVVFIGTFFQLVLMVADVTAHVSKDLLKTAYTLGANGKETFMRVLIPATLPGIFDNLRITLGWAWTYVVLAELIAADRGLGHMIMTAGRFNEMGKIFMGLVVIGSLGFLSDYLFKIAYRIYLPWSEKMEG